MRHRTLKGLALGVLLLAPSSFASAASPLPYFLEDRGEGVATSLFGSYVRKGELLVYPFYEYATSSNAEYHGSELGFAGEIDYLGKSEAHEAIVFLGYGLTDDLAVEFEAELYVRETLERAPDDTTTGMPPKIEESGLGDVEAQLRWRFLREKGGRPELYSNFEVTFPLQRSGDVLVGTSDWEFALGLGAVKGFHWGTLTSRVSLAHSSEEGVQLGEYAIEYLKRTSERWRWVSALEGEDDEVMLVLEAQWRLGPRAYWKFNSGFGVTEKAEDFAPEIGLMLSF